MWIERKARIRAPVSDVFAYVADFRTLKEYNRSIREVRSLTAGPPGEGSRYEILMSMLGKEFRTVLVITGFRKDEHIATRLEAFVPAREERMFQPAGDDTLFHFSIAFSCGWPIVGPLADRILAKLFARRQADMELRMLAGRFARRRETGLPPSG